MLAQLLFETRMGNAMLAILERKANLAIVEAQTLGDTRIPVAACDNHRDSDRSQYRPTIVYNYTGNNGGAQSEGDRLRGLLMAIHLYPWFDTRSEDPGGLQDVLVGMIKGLDQNDQVSLWTITTQLYGSCPPEDFWERHRVKQVEPWLK